MIDNSKQMIDIFKCWREKLNISDDFTFSNATWINLEEDLEDSRKLILYEFNDSTVIRMGKETAKTLGLGRSIQPYVSYHQLVHLCKKYDLSLKKEYKLYDYFLKQKKLQPCDYGYETAMLDRENDRTDMRTLFNACREKELDDADIYTDDIDPVNVGIYLDKILVAYASYRMFDSTVCDIGVLIHPMYRNKGLGKSVVSGICKLCFENNVIPMYRVFEDNPSSIRIPRALGFDMIVSVSRFDI